MAQLTGATYTPIPVPDYEEPLYATQKRLESVKISPRKTAWDHAKESLKEAAQENPALKTWRLKDNPLAASWVRTHYPPSITQDDSAPSDSSTESSPETAEVLLPPSNLASGASSDTSTSQSSEDSDPNPVDNSYPILDEPEAPLLEVMERFIRNADWAIDNAMHVAARRKKIRDAPSARAWALVGVAQEKGGVMALMVKVLEKYKSIMDEQEKLRQQETERLRKERESRVDANREVHGAIARIKARRAVTGFASNG